MSDQWLYRIYGHEFGPVSLDLVRTLVAAGTIAPDDEVRDASRSNWILACAAAELRDSIKTPKSNFAVERRIGRDEWFCRGAAGDFGPLNLTELIQLAAEGELRPDEEIKARADDYWRQVSSIRRLVELLPFPDENLRSLLEPTTPTLVEPRRLLKRDNAHTADGSAFGNRNGLSTTMEADSSRESESGPSFEALDIIPFPGARSTASSGMAEKRERASAGIGGQAPILDHSLDSLMSALAGCEVLSPLDDTDPIALFSRQDSESNLGDSQWTGWIGGEEFGPVSYVDLLTWAVTGRLSPTDFVRKGQEGQFVPAVNIPYLFTVRAAANSLFRRSVSKASLEAALTANSTGGQRRLGGVPGRSPDNPTSLSGATIVASPSADTESTTEKPWTIKFVPTARSGSGINGDRSNSLAPKSGQKVSSDIGSQTADSKRKAVAEKNDQTPSKTEGQTPLSGNTLGENAISFLRNLVTDRMSIGALAVFVTGLAVLVRVFGR